MWNISGYFSDFHLANFTVFWTHRNIGASCAMTNFCQGRFPDRCGEYMPRLSWRCLVIAAVWEEILTAFHDLWFNPRAQLGHDTHTHTHIHEMINEMYSRSLITLICLWNPYYFFLSNFVKLNYSITQFSSILLICQVPSDQSALCRSISNTSSNTKRNTVWRPGCGFSLFSVC